MNNLIRQALEVVVSILITWQPNDLSQLIIWQQWRQIDLTEEAITQATVRALRKWEREKLKRSENKRAVKFLTSKKLSSVFIIFWPPKAKAKHGKPFRLRLPYCGPRFESQTNHLLISVYSQELCCICHCIEKRTKTNKKAGLAFNSETWEEAFDSKNVDIRCWSYKVLSWYVWEN